MKKPDSSLAQKTALDIKNVQKEIFELVNSASDIKLLEELKNKYLGRKGKINAISQNLPEIPVDKRKEIGQALNKLKTETETSIDNKFKTLSRASAETSEANKEKIDITLPGNPVNHAHKHPLTQITQEISKIFISLGFQTATGPDIESDYYNFEALNIPAEHPARDMHDTFYIKTDSQPDGPGTTLLRTHTSPVQIRVMEKFQPPVRIIVPGRVYRNEAIDATHSAVFHQIEGLAVDENITFADLKATLATFAKKMFGEKIAVRFRPSYFPFTEPSAEMDVRCIFCGGKGCKICKNLGWLETLGCGMVNPRVFDYVKYDREKYTGFAFGIGVERITMLKFGVDDVRLFYENDLRFLKQF
ncbi:MAG: phenylalanine--tRNA ligase subunit alpha [Elusimicrobia bacterium]|nr:phenylalanine--tRNA ligase subunit alpha [Elusimicrobiota bacterium]MBU2615387.1 phenylalanine--tRNA ligase subunit alpha [Elusimicrobiota bacterium]